MSSAPRLVQRLGLALIAAGLVAGAAIYVCASSVPEVDLVARQREMRELARLGGTATVQTVKFNLWLASLWHGEQLGLTLALLGLVVGGACWQVGLYPQPSAETTKAPEDAQRSKKAKRSAQTCMFMMSV